MAALRVERLTVTILSASRRFFQSSTGMLWFLGAMFALMMAAALFSMSNWTGDVPVEEPSGLAVKTGLTNGALADVSCRQIGSIPRDVLSSWVLGYWTGLLPYSLTQQLPFMTSSAAGASVRYFCLAQPDLTIRDAAFQALAAMPGHHAPPRGRQ